MVRKYFVKLGFLAVLLVSIPIIVSQFINDMDWSITDYLFFAGLVLISELAYLFFVQQYKSSTYRLAVGLAVVGSFFLVWVNLAVGMIGSEDNPINLLYYLVVLVGIIGALISSIRKIKMEMVLWLMALIQFLIPVVALVINQPAMKTTEQIMGIIMVLILNFVFVLLFAFSALLFNRARLSKVRKGN